MTPKISGFAPTVFKVLIDNPEPIKNSVTVIPLLESMVMNEVKPQGG